MIFAIGFLRLLLYLPSFLWFESPIAGSVVEQEICYHVRGPR